MELSCGEVCSVRLWFHPLHSHRRLQLVVVRGPGLTGCRFAIASPPFSPTKNSAAWPGPDYKGARKAASHAAASSREH